LFLRYAHKDLIEDESFLYILNNFQRIEIGSEVFHILPICTQEKIREDPDYLSSCKAVDFKPARS
jgi:hypothetical protein